MVKAEQMTTTRVTGIKLELSMLEATTILREMTPNAAAGSKHYHENRKARIRKALLDAGTPLPFVPTRTVPRTIREVSLTSMARPWNIPTKMGR